MLRDQVTEHRVRLDNGRHAISDTRDSIKNVEGRVQSLSDQIRPRPPSIPKIVGITMTAVIAGATALWALSSILNGKTDTQDVESIIERKSSGNEVDHRSFQLKIQSLEQQIAEQKKMLIELSGKQNSANEAPATNSRSNRRRR